MFSSTTATYGCLARCRSPKRRKQKPINPYGFAKLVVEHALADYAHAYGLQYAALRYFNAAGASLDGQIGEDHTPESHLIPTRLASRARPARAISIFGNDYPTPDGTCIRDYIHVEDLATAHLAALERLKPGAQFKLNLGSGQGHSVREVLNLCRRVTGHPIPEIVGPRRPGDPPELVADPSKARAELGWNTHHSDLSTIVESAWSWHRQHPHGYRSP